MVKVRVNGQIVQVPDTLGTITDMVNHFSLSDRILIVEVNGVIAEKQDYDSTTIKELDSIEFVHFVGGG
ncbi:sulfur carrier protein ThiS [Bacillus haikouensis]|jgi:sulfur carrier protein|uniref:sulfur carrier protein ThiS n=1 Tax=Bacillus haikouensis TaxID=1510468 RepID=UPI001555339C|nr:sulfur carrier protein ThiS [Bacillus haikouensis]NQD67689.1 sulfur carrier protein ThiS [Bacillus haikouensis]